MAIKAALVLLVAVLPSSSASACQGSSCKVEVPQDEVSLMQMKMEGHPVDLDNGKNALAEEVEAGKQELREYVEELKGRHAENSTIGSGDCPGSWDLKNDANDALNMFLTYGCLTPQDPAKMSTGQTAELTACGTYNSASKKQGSFGFTQKDSSETGGVCATKAYTVKCPISKECAGLALYRAYSDPPAFSTKCPQWGGFWGAKNPTAMGAASYRTEYAICKKWNPLMNKVAAGHLNDAACGGVVLIGNGEAVKKGICGGDEAYDFSSYLQVVMCRRPSNCGNFPMTVSVSNGFQ